MLETILQERCNLDPGKPVLAGVSGGPDSLCLLGILREAGYQVIVAHFNHRLRPEAEQEAGAVSELAKRQGLPFMTDGADVREYAEEKSLSLEEAARMLRYRFLFTAARGHAAQAVAVGHTADDQVETVLMHFLRGAGLSGLKGMESRTFLPVFDAHIPLVRPLLSLWRADTETYCRLHNLEPHFDASNADTTYFRNRLRHALIPELEKYNPRFKEALLRTALVLQSDHAALQEGVDAAWKDIVAGEGEGWVAFERTGLATLSRGLRGNLLRRAAGLLQPESRDFGFETLERAVAFADEPTGDQIDLANGLYLFAEQGKIILASDTADLPVAQWPQVSQEFVIRDQGPDSRELNLELGNGWTLKVEEMRGDDASWKGNADNWSAWLDADRLPPVELVIRPRRPGDVFAPLGMGGQTIKVQDLYINLKIPRRARPQWPLVCAGEQVVWVVGYRIAHSLRITEKTKHTLHLEIKKLSKT